MTDKTLLIEPSPGPLRFGKYVLTREVLGEGACALVYRARHIDLGDDVAVKLMELPRGGADREIYERFVVEAQKLRLLSKAHRHVIRIEDFGETDRHVYIAMELAQSSLQERIQRERPFSVSNALRIGIDIGAALHASHERGLVHRDVKPANILFRTNGEAVLSDFGIAKELGQDQGRTLQNRLIGTPRYMSPEQARGSNQAVGARSDQFSLAVVLYELLCGAHPFAASDTQETLRRIRTASPPLPRSLRAELRPELEDVLLRALNKSPRKRYRSMADLVAALQKVMREIDQPDSIRVRQSGTTVAGVLRVGVPAATIVGVALGIAMLMRGLHPESAEAMLTEKSNSVAESPCESRERAPVVAVVATQAPAEPSLRAIPPSPQTPAEGQKPAAFEPPTAPEPVDPEPSTPERDPAGLSLTDLTAAQVRVFVDVRAQNAGGTEEWVREMRSELAELVSQRGFRVLHARQDRSSCDLVLHVQLSSSTRYLRAGLLRVQMSARAHLDNVAAELRDGSPIRRQSLQQHRDEGQAYAAAFAELVNRLEEPVKKTLETARERLNETRRSQPKPDVRDRHPKSSSAWK
jgi:serine/threonine protein kinase